MWSKSDPESVVGTCTSWENPLDDINWSKFDNLDLESRSSLKSPRMMVGTIWGRLSK